MPAWNTITAATMEHNYSISAPSGSEVLMASSLARSRECTEKFSPCRFRSGTFDFEENGKRREIMVEPLIRMDKEECEVQGRH